MPRKKAQSDTPPRILFLKVVYLPEGNAWVAQCLEHDIAAQGKTLPEAEEAFRRTILAQVALDIRKGREPLVNIKPAPRLYWRKWSEGVRLGVEPTIDLPRDITPAYMLEQIRGEARVA